MGYILLLYRGRVEERAGRQVRVGDTGAHRGLVAARASASHSTSVVLAAYTTILHYYTIDSDRHKRIRCALFCPPN